MTGHGKGTPKTTVYLGKAYCESELTGQDSFVVSFFKAQQQVFLQGYSDREKLYRFLNIGFKLYRLKY